MKTELAALVTGDSPQAWERLGFAVDGAGVCRLGGLVVRLDGTGGGVRGWVLRGSGGPREVDGIPTEWSAEPLARGAPPAHPNGATAVDHVVVFTDSRDRTVDAMERVGAQERRRAEPPDVPARMAFVRFGETIVEVAEVPEGPTRIWGLTAVVEDLDACARLAAERLGDARPAVQAGRRIATARPAPGLETALAFMTPRPPRPR